MTGPVSIPSGGRSSWYAIALILGAFLLAGILRLNDLSLYSPDSIRYVIWGNSLASGKGFVDDTQPEVQQFVEHAPFYSVLLAPVELFFPRSLTAVKVATILWGMLALYLFHRWLRSRMGKTAALAGTLLLVCNPLLLVYSSEALSEAPFVACLCAMLLLADRVIDDPAPGPRWILLVALAGTIGLLREIGVAAVLAIFVYFLLRRRFMRAGVLVCAAALCLGLWYVRNQVLVRLPEGSTKANSALVFQHFVSPAGTPLLSELAQRVWLSLHAYAWELGGMLFYPLHGSGQVNLAMSPAQFPSALRLLVIAAVLLAGAAGIAAERKEGAGAIFRGTLFLGYLLIVLVYPVHDIRFLFPILPLMIYYVIAGARFASGYIELLQGLGRPRVLVPLVLLLMLPNLLLMGEIIGTNMSYRRSPMGFYQELIKRPSYPTAYTYPWALVGDWIRNSVPEQSVIASPAKQIAIMVGTRKVLEANPGLTLPLFEKMIRDNDVSYLLSETQWEDYKLYEFLMGESERYRFDSVFAAANLHVYKVTSLLRNPGAAAPVRAVPIPDSLRAAGLLRMGRAHFLAGEYRSAAAYYLRAAERAPGQADPIYESVTAFAMEGDSLAAQRSYERLMAMPQAASLLYTARVHLDAMYVALSAKGVPPTQERAIKMNDLGRLYWDLGYKKRAEHLCDESLRLDSSYFWGLLWGFHFNLQNGDTADARHYFRQLSAMDAKNQVVMAFSQLLASSDSLCWVRDPAARSALHLSEARLYRAIELYEVALDEDERAIGEAPGNAAAVGLRREIFAARAHADSVSSGLIIVDRSATVDSLH